MAHSNEMRTRLLAHLREYGFEHFSSDAEYEAQLSARLGRRRKEFDMCRARFGSPPDVPDELDLVRGFLDLIADPHVAGIVASAQTDVSKRLDDLPSGAIPFGASAPADISYGLRGAFAHSNGPLVGTTRE